MAVEALFDSDGWGGPEEEPRVSQVWEAIEAVVSRVPLWVSDVLPGSTHDLTAARELVLPEARPYLKDLPILADSGYEGVGAGVHVPVKKPARGVTVPAEELGHLSFQRGLHQQLGTEPGHLLQDLRQRTILGEQLIDVVADTVSRRYSDRHGRGSFLR